MPTTKEDRAIVRALATRAVMEKTDRLLGWDGKVRVVTPKVNDGPDAVPAWTDGKTITINGQNADLHQTFYEGFDRESMLWLSGMNYHELAHCLFTPRMDSKMVRDVRNTKSFQAFNALEDQSAESKFVRLYTPARHYFTAVISKIMAGRQDLVATNYPLISGRKFLPKELRSLFRDNYALPHQIPEIERIVSAYCDCVYPSDRTQMVGLCQDFQALLDELRSQMHSDLDETSHHGDGSGQEGDEDHGLQEGKPVDEQTQREIVATPQFGEDLDDSEKGSGDGEGEQEGSEGSEEGQEGLGTPVPGAASGEDGEGSQSSNGEPPDEDGLPGGDGAGAFTGISKKWQPEVLDDLLNQLHQNAEDALSDELDSRAKSIKSSERNYTVDASQCPFEERPPDTEHVTAAQGVEKEFRRLRQKYKPGWHTRKETGKIDPNQIGNIQRGRTDVFRRFQPGVNNALDVEVVLLLDQSGSMYQHTRESSQALWILHRSMKNIGAEITALGYSDYNNCVVLLQRGVQTPRHIRDYYSGGSTHVMPALSETQRIFRVSNKALKLCVIVTDGMFSDSDQARQTLTSMTDPVAIVGINHDVNKTWDPNKIKSLIVSRTITHPVDLVPFTKNLVMDLAQKHYERIR